MSRPTSSIEPGAIRADRLAALRHLLDWMVISQIMQANPAAALRAAAHRAARQDAGARSSLV